MPTLPSPVGTHWGAALRETQDGYVGGILTRLDEIEIKPRDMTVRFDAYHVDPWAVSGLFAALAGGRVFSEERAKDLQSGLD